MDITKIRNNVRRVLNVALIISVLYVSFWLYNNSKTTRNTETQDTTTTVETKTEFSNRYQSLDINFSISYPEEVRLDLNNRNTATIASKENNSDQNINIKITKKNNQGNALETIANDLYKQYQINTSSVNPVAEFHLNSVQGFKLETNTERVYLITIDDNTYLEVIDSSSENKKVLATQIVETIKIVTTKAQQGETLEYYLVDLDNKSQSSESISCGDSLVKLTSIVTTIENKSTEGLIKAALENLLSMKSQYYEDKKYYNSLYQSDLTIDKLIVNLGEVKVFLHGKYKLGGICDEDRFQQQITKTVLQFPEVYNVVIYINNELLEEPQK